MTTQETPKQEQKITPPAANKTDVIPAQYKGMPSEVVEELWQSKVYVDPEKNSAEAERRRQALDAIKKGETDREATKQEQFAEQYSKLPPEQRAEFQTAQTDAGKILNEHIQSKRDIEGLSPEETFVLDKLKTAYAEFKKENPDKSFAFDFSRDIDRSVYNNLTQRLAFKVLEGRRHIGDQEKANVIRRELGVPEQEIQTEELLIPTQDTELAPKTKQESIEEQMEEYLKLPNVQEARQKIHVLLKHVKEKQGGTWDKYKLDNLQAQIYEMLSTRSQFPQLLAEAGGEAATLQQRFQEQDTRYRAIMKQVEKEAKDSGFDFVKGAWSGINTRPEVGAREKLNYKSYTTIPIDNPDFIQHLPSLASELRKLAVDSDDIIQVKVPASHGIFLKRNDSLVVHFKKPENTDKVQEILAQWEQTNSITEEPREMGRVKVAADPKGTSFSDAVASGVAEWIRQQHETGNIDDAKLIDSGIRYAIEQSQRPPKVGK